MSNRANKVPMVIALLALIVSLANSSRVGEATRTGSHIIQLQEQLENAQLDIQYLTEELQKMNVTLAEVQSNEAPAPIEPGRE